MFDQFKADYRRHEKSLLNPALWAVCNFRFGRSVMRIRFAPLRWFLRKIYGFNLFLILITSGIRLYCETQIGEDFHLIHSGNINIHPQTVIGDRCGIQHDVTIGTSIGPGVPVIGNDVFIGTGAKILGNITIGDGATIAANSLVITDVPAHTTAMGVPARVWKYSAVEAKIQKEGSRTDIKEANEDKKAD
ncbi:MAG: serine acetyltransferase [Spirochaetae bacterium HGW-Spirochaetae-1]|jgi:serine O-acetyltransferase|nr:MAG: serine acetyltransferase [Spirochaetae bacterium HGW-Spirochaetae-1]